MLRRTESAQRQRCKVCGKLDKFDFHVPDVVWHEVVPPKFSGRVVCLSCFDEFARRKQIQYAAYVHTLYFAGDRAVFVFQAVSAVDVED